MSESAAPSIQSRRRPPLWALLLGKLLEPWIRLRIEPSDGVARLAADTRPVCYVLERYGLSNALILERACRESGLPSPLMPLAGDPLGHKRAYIALSRRRGAWFGRPRTRTHSEGLEKLLALQRSHPDLDIQLVPVSIFIGRAPDRQSGWFSVLFSENWELVGRFRRLLAVLLNGRNTIVQYAMPVPLRSAIAEELPAERTVRKLSRVLRVHFGRIRTAVIGPDLSHRRLLVGKVLASAPVQQAIADQARRDNKPVADAWHKAHAIAWEIAADYSHPVVRSLSFVLTPFWNRIYDGVQVHHLDTLKDIAPGNEVVYVPSHRSHIDYLLLSYLLYSHSIVPPHVVAGVNLNMPVIGPLLRKGGAFFIRRSIRGSALYSAVLSEYVAMLVTEGFSLEYFIEGGRSRTGRLLQPQAGLLAMTVRGYLRQPRRPVVFQPIYIGYEKVMESKSYLDELAGRPKHKETVWALLRGAIGALRQRYGKVALSFGEPILLDDILQQHAPDWRELAVTDGERPKWLKETIDDLAQRIQVNTNRSADVNPVNLLALTLLSMPKHAMNESDLLEQLALAKRLLAAIPYSDRVTVTKNDPSQIVAYGEGIGILQRTAHPLGDVIWMDDETAVLQTYYRNNVLHLFTAPAWVACCFQNNRRMTRADVLALGRTLYPFLQNELFLPWTPDGFGECLEATVVQFVTEGLLKFDPATDMLRRGPGQTDEVFQLRSIAHSLQQAFERYFIAIAVLVKNGPHTLSAGELENLCQMTAQRLSLLYAPAAPEFFDRALFRGFIQKMREIGIVKTDGDGKLDYGEQLDAWAKDAKLILGRELRHTILKITPETARAAQAGATGPTETSSSVE
ncbi:MAG TPA: glycerol-3-phosphate 1-O-acyltransferase PlsB [Xanthomonadaceae bacterium]|nr:glycerol-3-phosphate 1-O-acyltransferase PlsB [Xanthomonadaceae bacterium]